MMPPLAFYFLPISLFSIFWCSQITEGVKHLHRRSFRSHQMETNIDAILDAVDDPDTSSCHYERKNEVYQIEDLREAHAGLFRDIEWTKEERLLISDLHSTQQYHLLGPLLKKKLQEIDASLQYKTEVTKFFVDHYPPAEVRQLHDNASKCRIREILASEKPEIGEAIMVTGERLQRLTKPTVDLIQNYIISNSRPRQFPNAEEEQIIV